MAGELTVVTINRLNEDIEEVISVSGTYTLGMMYELVADAQRLKKGSFTLEHDSGKLEEGRKLVNETELEDSCEVFITLSTAEKAKMQLAQLGRKPTVNAMCEASAEGDADLVQLYIDAGVDPNGRYFLPNSY
ncbi:hypothetical protein DIPPA_15975 [Diplonema papillatum]|nr:hypothetical protein DIPPA_21247 [Diplonema papillatum]KAJ9464378.1 hypothetical protein DIPPA_15975 [Diplonema papillatum]